MAEKEFTCPVAGTLSMIGGKYKSIILYHLMKETLRYSESVSYTHLWHSIWG